jgi:hypothetical protein
MKTYERLIAGWEAKGWHVQLEENPNRETKERFSCEVYEVMHKEPLPRGLGYVCGYGATATSAVIDAEMKLNYQEPKSDAISI